MQTFVDDTNIYPSVGGGVTILLATLEGIKLTCDGSHKLSLQQHQCYITITPVPLLVGQAQLKELEIKLNKIIKSQF